MGEKLFSKLNIKKNYSNLLEEILEKKDFSENTKSYLLNMFYKVDTSYEDYALVKRNVKSKEEFLQEIIDVIQMCNNFKIVDYKSEDSKILEENKVNFYIDEIAKTIISYPNEVIVLDAINHINVKRIYLNEEYSILINALPALLNSGRDISNVEIIRDFNAWTWIDGRGYLENFEYNLIYQNLQILLGYEKLEKWLSASDIENHVEVLENMMDEIYEEDLVEKFLQLLYEISIYIYIENNTIEKNRIIEEYENKQEEYEKLNNRETFVRELFALQSKTLKKISEIDIVLKDKEMLEKELIKRGKENSRTVIFSINQLIEVLTKEKRMANRNLQRYNKLVNNNNYKEIVSNLKKDLELLKDLNLESEDKFLLSKKILKIEKLFLECLKCKVEKEEDRKELIKMFYVLRYYEFIPYQEKYVKDISGLKKEIDIVQQILLKKMIKSKMISSISKDEEANVRILQNLFNTRIINLENLNFIIMKNVTDELQIEIYDGEMLEKTIEIENNEIDVKKVKLNKKNKLFK